jgi:putative membrane protein
MSRTPRAYPLNALKEGHILAEQGPDPFAEKAALPEAPVFEKRSLWQRINWGALAFASLGGLMSLAVLLWAEKLILELLSLHPSLGWLAMAWAAIIVVALLIILIREIRGVMHERKIEQLRAALADILIHQDHQRAKSVVEEVNALYQHNPYKAAARARFEAARDEILDAEDRIALTERLFMAPLDKKAKEMIAEAAKQVSLVTAISPRALIDVLFVIYRAAQLLRQLAQLYSGRPSFFGFLRLSRVALSHLAVTGGMAAGDSLIQQALGHGLAAKVSAKLGEGVLNGIMTARFGLAALQACRPMPFHVLKPPRLSEVAGQLWPEKEEDAS